MEKQLISYQHELATDLAQLLSSEEKEILNGNTIKIEDIRKRLTETANQRSEVKKKKEKKIDCFFLSRHILI